MNEEHLTALFKIKSLLDDLKEENTIQPKIDILDILNQTSFNLCYIKRITQINFFFDIHIVKSCLSVN